MGETVGDSPGAPLWVLVKEECMTNQPPPDRQELEGVLQYMIGGCSTSQLIYAAAKLGIADRLAIGPKRSDELAAEVGAQPEFLYRLLRALAVVGLFTERPGRTFALTALGALLKSSDPQSLRGWAIVHGEELYRAWGGLLHTVQTGQPGFEYSYGSTWWDHLDRHPETAAAFNQQMTTFFEQRNAAVAEAYDFSSCRTIVDVAGGQGALLAAILQANPAARGVLFDLPAVVESAPQLLEQAGVQARSEVVGGDMFAGLPTGGDAYLLATIIHDWNDENAVAVLRNVRQAMGREGRLLLVEVIVPSDSSRSPTKIMDVSMMVLMHGKERTEAEYRELYRAAGFALTRVIETESGYSIIEGRPV